MHGSYQLWVPAVLYLLGVAATWWLGIHNRFFAMVCLDEPGRMSVFWPLTWLAATCALLLYATSVVHEWVVERHEG